MYPFEIPNPPKARSANTGVGYVLGGIVFALAVLALSAAVIFAGSLGLLAILAQFGIMSPLAAVPSAGLMTLAVVILGAIFG